MYRVVLLIALVGVAPSLAAEPVSALDRFKAAAIPEAARFADAPPELVAVLGQPLPSSTVGHYRFRAAIRPDGRMLAATLSKHKIALWDLRGPEPVMVPLSIEPSGHDSTIRFSPDNTRLAVSGGNNLHLWDVSGPEPRKKATLRAKSGVFEALAFDFTPDSRSLVIGGRKGAITTWDLAEPEPKELCQLSFPKKTYIWALALSPDGKTVAASAFSNRVVLVDRSGAEPKERAVLPHGGWALAVAFAPDGKQLALGIENGPVPLVWNMADGKFAAIPFEKSAGRTVNSVAFSPDAKLLAGCCFDKGQVVVWDTASGKKRWEWKLPGANEVAFAPDGRHLITANDTNTVYILRLSTDAGKQSR